MQKKIHSHLSLLRPHQWLKNLLIFFPPFFGGKLGDPRIFSLLIPAFLSFSCAASCGYIINDLRDKKHDRHHASKKFRAIASGEVTFIAASLIALILYVISMLLAASISQRYEGYIVIYLLVTFLYTIYFKNVAIIDIFFVAVGFLIRVMAGGEAFHVKVTNWLFLTVFIVAIFLATGKRLGELISEGTNALQHRVSLNHYSISFLEGVLWFSASSALVTYALYVIENRDGMIYTVPLAAFGLLRYIYIVKQGKGDPTEVLLVDSPILITGIIWSAMVAVLTYH